MENPLLRANSPSKSTWKSNMLSRYLLLWKHFMMSWKHVYIFLLPLNSSNLPCKGYQLELWYLSAPCCLLGVPKATLFMPLALYSGCCFRFEFSLAWPPSHSYGCGKFGIIFQSPIQVSSALRRFSAAPAPSLIHFLFTSKRINCFHILYLSLMEFNRAVGLCPSLLLDHLMLETDPFFIFMSLSLSDSTWCTNRCLIQIYLSIFAPFFKTFFCLGCP